MRTTSTIPADTYVDPAALACPGCLDTIRIEPPSYPQVRYEMPVPGFSHRDGTALCRDSAGRPCEPVEITLTDGW